MAAFGHASAAVLLLAAMLAAGAGAVATAALDLADARAERDGKAEVLARSVDAGRRAKLATGPEREADPLIAADSATLAAARAEGLVRAAAEKAGCELTSSRAEVKAAEPGIGTRIEVQATMEGGNDALQATLLRMETGAPALIVEDLSITPAEGRGDEAGTDPAAGGEARMLRLSVTLLAFWRAVQPAAPAVQNR